MPLADRLEPRPARRPRDYQTSVAYDASGQPGEVSVNLTDIPADEAGWRESIGQVTGLAVPDDREVVLTQVRYWGPANDAEKNAYCRFVLRDRVVSADVDALGILRDLRKGARRGPRVTGGSEAADVLSWNDWQVGKSEGGGTLAVLERFNSAIDEHLERRRQDAKCWRPDELVIIGGGDIIEGCEIFQNHGYTLDADRREQIDVAVTMILEGLDRLALHYTRVRVPVVGGNHGEHRVKGKRTTRHDNDDCAVFEHAARAAARDPRLQHVEFFIAQSEPVVTLDVQGWILGTTHGQAFDRGAGGNIEAKVYRWYSQQAAGRLPAGDADVLVTHHFHHQALADWGACLWAQTPALDGGSGHFTETSGRWSDPGMLAFRMTPERRFTESHILR